MAPKRDGSQLSRFIHSLRQEKIPFLIAGMTAAVLQGVPVVTNDVDLWIGTPQTNHDAVLRLCHGLGAAIFTDHVVELSDGAQLHFTYSIGGLKSFSEEIKRARKLRWMGHLVAVLSLEQLQQSKKCVGRPKDMVHLAYIRSALAFKRSKKSSGRPRKF